MLKHIRASFLQAAYRNELLACINLCLHVSVLDQQLCICKPETYAFDRKPARLVAANSGIGAYMQSLG